MPKSFSKLSLFCGFFSLLFFTACVLPPAKVEPKVRSAEEWSFATLVTRGERLTNSGDLSGAEEAFLQAIGQNSAHAGVWNNLGYVEMREERFAAAKRSFLRALALDKNYFPAQINLARLAFESGDAEEAVRQYDALVAVASAKLGQPGSTVTNVSLAKLYLDYSAALFSSGNYDEAICNAEAAYQFDPDPALLTHFVRLLFVAEENQRALSVISNYLAASAKADVPDLNFDYGLALYLKDDLAASYSAFELVADSPNAGKLLQRDARVMQAVIDSRLNKEAEAKVVLSTLGKGREKLCGSNLTEAFRYWPNKSFHDATKVVKGYCHEQNQPTS